MELYYTNNDLMSQNYIYLYHIAPVATDGDEWLFLPEYPDEVSDRMNSTFAQTNALSRTAPVFTYSNSGPRTVNFRMHFHRDLLEDANRNAGNNFSRNEGEDYVEALVRKIQSIALPRYDFENKAVVPPMIALRIGNDIFVKGVVIGGVSITYEKPIMANNKYSQATIAFDIYEVDPYDAESVSEWGSFRGITRMFKDGKYS